MQEDEHEARVCECGCGEPVTKRFVKGHHLRNDAAPWFKGDSVGYRALHTYLGKHYPKSGICEECGKTKRTEYALIKGREYTRSREDYRELCKRCHNLYDELGFLRRRDEYLQRTELAKQAAGDASSCKCGCGILVDWDKKHMRWYKYAPGHYDDNARVRHLENP